eukprot:scaffold2670_cov408-Pavlova_lutheri.AAC.2
MGDLGGGSAHRLVALDEVTRTSGEDTQVRKVKHRRCVMCGTKASEACHTCHKPSEGIIAYLCGPYTGRDCAALHMAGVPSRRRRRVSGADVHTPAPACLMRGRRRRSTE